MKQNQGHGTTNISLPTQMSKTKSNSTSSNNIQTISKFFKQQSKETISRNSDIQSPYNSVVKSEIKGYLNDSTSEESDFKSPKRTRNSTIQKKEKPKPSKSRGRGRPRSTQTKLTKGESSKLDLDVNLDHLQMAIALSRSTYEADNSINKQDEKNNSYKYHTLEQFMFKCEKKQLAAQNRRIFEVQPKRRKPGRFKYVTPILKMRTPEDRESLISSKIATILAQNTCPTCSMKQEYILKSNLREYVAKESVIFKTNNIILEHQQPELYYVKALNLEYSQVKSGSLLRDWTKIAGRDQSPERNYNPISKIDASAMIHRKDNIENYQPSNHNSPETNDIHLTVANMEINKLNDSLEIILPENTLSFKNNSCNRSISEIILPENTLSVKNNSCNRSISPDLFASDEETEVFNNPINLYAFPENKMRSSKESIPTTSKYLDQIDLTLSSDEETNSCENDKVKQKSIAEITEIKQLSQSYKEVEVDEEENKAAVKYNCSDPSMNLHLSEISDKEEKKELVHDLTLSSDDEISEHKFSKRPSISPITNFKSQSGIIHFEGYSQNFKATNYYSLESSDEETSFAKIKEICTQNEYIISNDMVKSDAKAKKTTPSPEIILNNGEHDSSENKSSGPFSPEADSPIHKTRTTSISEGNQSERPSISPITNYTSQSGIIHFEGYSQNFKVTSNYYSLESSDEESSTAKIKEVCTQYEYTVSNDCGDHMNTELEMQNSSLNDMVKSDGGANKTIHLPEIIINDDEHDFSQNKSSGSFSPEIHSPVQKTITRISEGNQSESHEVSFRYNTTSSLNVTDYITQMLNRQDSFKNDPIQKSMDKEPEKRLSLHHINESIELNNSRNSFLDAESPKLIETIKYHNEIGTPKSTEIKRAQSLEIGSDTDDYPSKFSSQDCLNDDELNYSCHYATPYMENYDIFENGCNNDEMIIKNHLSTPHNNSNTPRSSKSRTLNSMKSLATEFLNDSFDNVLESVEICNEIVKEPGEVEQQADFTSTPTNVIIKNHNVTPMLDYDSMDTPKIVKELNKFGLKPLKRQRGVKLLKHIYENTHPFADNESDEDDLPDSKKRKTNKLKMVNEDNLYQSNQQNSCKRTGDIVGSEQMDDLIFERKFSVRIASCRIPLQIVWHNFLAENPEIEKNILVYEPVQLEVLHKMLKEQGFKFHIQDLLTFLDKKCITVRTAQGSQKAKKHF